MPELPSGTVTFLFTDLAVSTRAWEQEPEAMRGALARHDRILRDAVAAHAGHLVKGRGDGIHAVFATAGSAVEAAVKAQLALSVEAWDVSDPLRVRMGLHSGVAELRDGDYFGTAVNRAARLMGVAHGGQVVCSHVTADLARDELGANVKLLDLGDHWLPDLGAPERVYQVTHVDLPYEFPPLRTVDAFPGNLPQPASDLVGRRDELAELAVMLGRSRVVTLTGSGGVGKTRLAVQAAAVAIANYPDGAWFVDLAPIDDEHFVASEIVTTLGLPERRHGNREDALVGALARRHVLVVLDNCEHLVETVARVVDLVARRCPDVTVLATSQEVLGVGGEATFAVRPLANQEATALFVARAAEARHGFEHTADNAAAIGELCRRLDGIPLAIELAAARVASMSPTAILERIDERFRLLGHGRRTARRRHQTLRAAVDWSYGLLDQQEQVVFARLSVFAGDFTLEGAEAVVVDHEVDAPGVLDVVTGLVEKSMVQLDARPDRDRYRLLETMRDYGLERLAEREESALLNQRHAAYYAWLVEAARPHLVGADDITWSARLDDEYPNLRAALAWTHENGDDDTFVRLAFSLARYWWQRGMQREAFAWIVAALDVEHTTAAPRDRAQLLALAGHMGLLLDRSDAAMGYVERSLACSADAAEPPCSLALMTLSMAGVLQNRPHDARRYGEEAVTIARAAGDPYDLAEALGQVSSFLAVSVDDNRGVALADEGLTIARALGNSYLTRSLLMSSGVSRYRSDPALAVKRLAEHLATVGPRNSASESQACFFKALAHVMLRQPDHAARELMAALPLMQENGEPYFQSMALALAAIVLSPSDPEASIRILALNQQLRDDGRFVGAARDIEAQVAVRRRLEAKVGSERSTVLSAEGRAMTLDDATAVVLDRLAAIGEAP
jgi:predicted ATPase/class 3 adenylate cyclase